MDCQRAQNLLEPYFDGKISDYELEEFIHHVRGCSSCHETLEIYYVMDLAKKYMEEDSEDCYNIIQVLEGDMERRLKRAHKKQKIRNFIFCIIMLFFGFVAIAICLLI